MSNEKSQKVNEEENWIINPKGSEPQMTQSVKNCLASLKLSLSTGSSSRPTAGNGIADFLLKVNI